MKRRDLLNVTASLGILGVSGCTSDLYQITVQHPPGTLKITNWTENSRKLLISIEKEFRWNISAQFSINGSEKIVREGYLTEPGVYDVYVTLDGEKNETAEWHLGEGLYGLSGEWLHIVITEEYLIISRVIED